MGSHEFTEGYNAYWYAPKSKNPYEYGSREAVDWEKGFEFALMEHSASIDDYYEGM